MQQNLDTSGLELTEGTLKVSKPNRLLELEG